MTTLQNTFNHLAETENTVSNLYASEGETPKAISEPIDVGADDLLESYKNAWFSYPPLEVEYLIQTLNEHLSNCLDLREKAQDLEIKAFIEANDQLVQRKLLESIEEQMKLFALNEPKLLANTIETKLNKESGEFSGSNSEYWLSVFAKQREQLNIKKKSIDNRLLRLNEEGGGSNYVARFDFLKELFKIDLIEAYCRSRSAALGLKNIYGIDIPVPEITNVGFLDKLILWSREVTYKLEKKFFNIRETTVAFCLHDGATGAAATTAPVNDTPRIFTLDSFKAVRQGQTPVYTFQIKEDFFKRLDLNLKNPRLKGLDINIIGNDDKHPQKYWRVLVQPPEKRINTILGGQPYSYRAKLYLPMSTYAANVSDIHNVPNRREVNNLSPIGEWTIRIEPTSVFGNVKNTDDTLLNNLLIRMKVAHERD